jgi:D-alanyl-lipoteichoic acid acyltransferase DltB (MBOAT superfamily)
MLFPTVDFAVFFTVVLGLSWLLRGRYVLWRLFVIAASWTFYGWWDARFVLLLAASTAGNYAFGRLIDRTLAVRTRAVEEEDSGLQLAAVAGARTVARAAPVLRAVPPTVRERTRWTPWAVGAGVAMNLAVLGWFKYYGFFATSLDNTLNDIGLGMPLPLLQITLPIGISFFTFQAISYLVDISRGAVRPMRPLDFAVYLSFFPHLVAGPIVRASEFAPQLSRPANASAIPATEAAVLIMSGLFKKLVISSFLAREIVDPVFGVPSQHSSLEIVVATYAYAVQIFADFSGYTDIAIGCALLLGFRFPQNFDHPYRARSLQDFWRRWHMTLSRWLRDYLYIPLGGSRGNVIFTARNLLITMVLGGLWHGAAWTFVVWGAIHGVGLVAERLIWRGRAAAAQTSGWVEAARWAVTFHVVCLAWVFFRAESIGDAWQLLARAGTAWGPAPLVSPLVVGVIAGMMVLQFAPKRLPEMALVRFSQLQPLVQAAAFALAFVAIDALRPTGVSPFIYFRF